MTINLSDSTQDFILRHRTEDIRKLALKASKDKGVDMPTALAQIEGWQIACRKLPAWSRTDGILYPPHLSMEQCSSEATAGYKATILGKGDTFTDLTGGFGVDCSYLARSFKQAWYVERNETLCAIARHNFATLGLHHIQVCNEESAQFLKHMPPKDALFLDPARRDEHGGKTVSISDCTPDVKDLFPILCTKAERILVKLSPMLDISQAIQDLPRITTIHVISVNNECKELLLFYDGKKEEGYPVFHTINMGKTMQRFNFTREEEQEAICTYASQPESFLYEPNAALLKAGAYRILSHKFHVKKLHTNSHLYTSYTLCPSFPGRIFRIDSFSSFSKKDLKSFLPEDRKANLTVRNFPASVSDLRKRLKLKEGGDVYLFATTLQKGDKVLIKCRKVNPDFSPAHI